MKEVELEVYNPTGAVDITEVFAPRLADLNGKTICELSNGSWQDTRTFPVIRELLQKRFPRAKIIPYTEFARGRAEVETDENIDLVVKKGCDAVITGNAGWGSCATACGRAAAKAEKRDIPAMVVTREDFSQVVCNSYAALGFPTEAPWVYEFPNRMFVAGSDLSVINENIDKIIYGLTKWEPKRKTKGITAAQKLTVRGKDYEEALTNMHYMFLRNMWSDGLPLFPPTEERVNWILRGTDLSRDTVVAKILPGGRIASVESLSIALAMTGGRPEYLPVLIAAIEAFTEPEFRHDWMNSTTGSVYPGVVVNGPIAKQIRLNSGYSFLGPNPNFPAGGPIGRALRIVFLDIGGAIPGIGSLSISGVNRYTNMVFAEDDDGLPSGWKPLSVEQGFPEGKNVVTVVPACDYDHVMSANVSTEESLHTVLGTFGRVMDYPNLGLLRTGVDMEKMVGIVLIPRRTAVGFADLGLSKEDVRKGLWENSRISWSDIKAAYSDSYIRSAIERAGDVFVEGKPWPITRTSEQIMMVVAGGDQSGHASFVRFGGASNYIVVSKEIKLPANEKWEELLKESEMDLGPVPVA